MKPESKKFQVEIGGKTMIFETGLLAVQAGGAVTVSLDDAMIFGVATMGKEPREGIDFLPLTVDYEERMYAGGRIPGSFFRREGRPTEEAILTDRLTDRPLRPLFPKRFAERCAAHLVFPLSRRRNPTGYSGHQCCICSG